MKKSLRQLVFLLCMAVVFVSCKTEQPADPITTQEEETPGSGIGVARDISSFELVDEMGVGWNLGNYFDVTSRDKTSWGNPKPTSAMIDAVHRMGFRTLRIPITWGYNQGDATPFTIESSYLDEVQRVVDYGFKNKMHVIIKCAPRQCLGASDGG